MSHPTEPPPHDAPEAGQSRVDFEQVEGSEDFRRLRSTHRRIIVPLTIVFLLWYFVYVLLGAYAHSFMATPVIGNINVGLLLGLGQFVTTFAITMIYVALANRRLDPQAAALREQLEAVDHPDGALGDEPRADGPTPAGGPA
ncbi:DUF485 domain-containing protein [Brevibacterium sp. 5221]|uniref:DUF485 domain-containing protein n=1 Tax=Brevibacterium rongguiense TaxID=2695267 RepID=A0A6N9H3P1_9MICO|nr:MULTISPECIES: DUF485 domain-containing protein [Brevibacterium]MYM18565.1 DUF485 domain-containing protein [Brevibacterium rongguiense]WAL39639.1 DUF485 domain-containing protein [Brevibacterium sp. BRM-1]